MNLSWAFNAAFLSGFLALASYCLMLAALTKSLSADFLIISTVTFWSAAVFFTNSFLAA
jgi:hypothetical protein